MKKYSVTGSDSRARNAVRKQLKREAWIVDSIGGRIEMVMEYWLLLDQPEARETDWEHFERPLGAIGPGLGGGEF